MKVLIAVVMLLVAYAFPGKLGISYDEVVKHFEHSLAFKSQNDISGLPSYYGISDDRSVIFEVTGDKNDVSYVNLTFVINGDSPNETANTTAAYISLLMSVMVPEWADGGKWVFNSIGKMNKKLSIGELAQYSKVYGTKCISTLGFANGNAAAIILHIGGVKDESCN